MDELAGACTCPVPPPLLDGAISGFSSLFFFCLTTAFFFIGVLSAAPLLSVLLSLPPSLCCSLPRSLLGQFNQGAMRPLASLLFHHAVTLSGEKYSFIGFLSLSFFSCLSLSVSSHCSVPRPLISPSASISTPLPLHLSFISFHPSSTPPARSHHHLVLVSLFARGAILSVPSPHLLLCVPEYFFPTLTAGTKAHSNQISSNHKPVGH